MARMLARPSKVARGSVAAGLSRAPPAVCRPPKSEQPLRRPVLSSKSLTKNESPSDRHRHLRASRAHYRAEAARYEQANETLLEARSVSRGVEETYRQRMEGFVEWAEVHGMALEGLPDRDEALARFATFMFLEGLSAAEFSKVRVAAAFFWKDVSRAGRDLIRAAKAQRGFCKLAPASSRVPAPWLMVPHAASEMAKRGHWEWAMTVLVLFMGYLRLGDLKDALGRHL